MQKGIRQSQKKTNTAQFHFHEVPRAVTFVETENRMQGEGLEEGTGGWLSNAYGVSLCGKERALEAVCAPV